LLFIVIVNADDNRRQTDDSQAQPPEKRKWKNAKKQLTFRLAGVIYLVN
jgi:hypothetical protein